MQYAGFWRRLVALIIDSVVPWCFLCVLSTLKGVTFANYIVISCTICLLCILYEVLFLKFFGATIGKLIVQIRVTRQDGSPLGWREAILRNLIGYILSIGSTILVIITVGNNLQVLMVRSITLRLQKT